MPSPDFDACGQFPGEIEQRTFNGMFELSFFRRSSTS
jgi:hypothetical protein